MADQQHEPHSLFLQSLGSQRLSRSTPIVEFHDIPGQALAKGRNMPGETDRDVAQRPAGGRSQRSHPRHAICQGDNVFGDLVPIGGPGVEGGLIGTNDKHGGNL
jgi:hypothetical protein